MRRLSTTMTGMARPCRFDLWSIKDREQILDLNADALSVLLRIMDDGHVRAGWSMRKARPTIYGPRPACCFTEMPLFALLSYARSRADSLAVDCYGIGLLKRELFTAGGRPVIYGLSGQHHECGDERWPRRLHPSCGIAEHEQYRYVAMNLDGEHPNDWSHEREWRWADVQDKFDCPGLPIWLQNAFISFSTVVVIVRTYQEAERVLDKLKLMRDAKTDQYCNPYAREAILSTRVLAVEDALAHDDKLKRQVMRIDDLPVHQLKAVVAPMPNQELLLRIAAAVGKAKAAANQAAREWRDSHDRRDVFGFAYLMIGGPRTEVVEAMLLLKEINEIALSDGIGYRMANIGENHETGLLGEAESAVHAATKVLEQELPTTHFYIRTVWD